LDKEVTKINVSLNNKEMPNIIELNKKIKINQFNINNQNQNTDRCIKSDLMYSSRFNSKIPISSRTNKNIQKI